jgi:hypothetical protein
LALQAAGQVGDLGGGLGEAGGDGRAAAVFVGVGGVKGAVSRLRLRM